MASSQKVDQKDHKSPRHWHFGRVQKSTMNKSAVLISSVLQLLIVVPDNIVFVFGAGVLDGPPVEQPVRRIDWENGP